MQTVNWTKTIGEYEVDFVCYGDEEGSFLIKKGGEPFYSLSRLDGWIMAHEEPKEWLEKTAHETVNGKFVAFDPNAHKFLTERNGKLQCAYCRSQATEFPIDKINRFWGKQIIVVRVGSREEAEIRRNFPDPRKRIPPIDRKAVYERSRGKCAYCGKLIAITEMEVDHLDARHLHNGPDSLSNYICSCRDCNRKKSDYGLEEFRNAIIPACIKRYKAEGFRYVMRDKPLWYRIAVAYKDKGWPIKFYFEED